MNNYVSAVFGVLGVLAALTFPVTPGNAAEAQTVLGGKLVVCGVCHGVNGLPKLEGALKKQIAAGKVNLDDPVTTIALS